MILSNLFSVYGEQHAQRHRQREEGCDQADGQFFAGARPRSAAGEGVFPLRLFPAHFAEDVLFYFARRKDGLRFFLQHLFYAFHFPPSFIRYALSFFSASPYFHVTVPTGRASMAATSRRL